MLLGVSISLSFAGVHLWQQKLCCYICQQRDRLGSHIGPGAQLPSPQHWPPDTYCAGIPRECALWGDQAVGHRLCYRRLHVLFRELWVNLCFMWALFYSLLLQVFLTLRFTMGGWLTVQFPYAHRGQFYLERKSWPSMTWLMSFRFLPTRNLAGHFPCLPSVPILLQSQPVCAKVKISMEKLPFEPNYAK